MFCTKCGAKVEDGAKFCTSCGQPLGEAAAPVQTAAPAVEAAPMAEAPAVEAAPVAAPSEKKDTVAELKEKAKALWATIVEKAKPVTEKIDAKATEILGDKKNYAYAGVLVLLGIIISACALAAIIPDGNGYLTYEKSAQLMGYEETVYMFTEGKLVEIKTDAEGVYDFTSSIDGEVIVFEYDGELYQIKGKKAKSFAEDIDSYRLSLYGDSVVYTVVEDGETTYYYAKVGSTKAVEIFTNEIDLLDGKLLSSYVISPDGKSVAYTVTEGLETDLYYFNGKKSEKVAGCDGTVIGMSNGGKYIYANVIDEDLTTKLYVYNKNGKREKIDSSEGSFALNLDGTEILYYNKGKTYISVKGKEGVKVAGAAVSLLRPRYTNTINYKNCTVYPVETLFDHVYTADTTAYYVAKKESKCIKLVNADSSRINLDAGAEFLYYFDDETLMCLEIAKGEKAKGKAKEIAEDVENFVLTMDRKYLYYVSDSELYVVNGKKGGKAKTIEGDDVYTEMTISRDDVLYYYCEDAVCATKGKAKGKVVLEEAEFENLGGYIYIVDEDAMYAARGKSKPKLLLERE